MHVSRRTPGQVSALVTQNVDGLHSRAGSRRVVDLHGRNDTVVCRSCSAARPRLDYQLELEQVNAEWMAQYMPPLQDVGEIRADGDAHLAREDFQGFKVVPCHQCDDGVVMPDVVFFGGSLRKETRDLAKQFVEGASGVLVLGTSVKVFSAFQLVQAAAAPCRRVPRVAARAAADSRFPAASFRRERLDSGTRIWTGSSVNQETVARFQSARVSVD